MDSDTPFTWYNRLYLNWQPAVLCKQTSNRWQPCWTNSHCLFNRLSHWVVQPVWQLAVYTIQPFVKQVVKTNRLVDCLYTWYNWLSNRIDNWLYRVNGALYLPGCASVRPHLTHASLGPPSPYPKYRLDWFSGFCTTYCWRSLCFTMATAFPAKLPSCMRIWIPANTFLGPPRSAAQMASRSVQPFLHSSRQRVPTLYNGSPADKGLLAQPTVCQTVHLLCVHLVS